MNRIFLGMVFLNTLFLSICNSPVFNYNFFLITVLPIANALLLGDGLNPPQILATLSGYCIYLNGLFF